MRIRSQLSAVVALAAALSAARDVRAQNQPVVDFTEYTYSVGAGGIGTFANLPVERTFSAPIASLRVFIVAGQADDIGYVGSRMVTSMPAMCAGVGSVTGEQEVTDQVTISGNRASFLLRAQENCCCTTGWGSATAAGRANARFRWEVVLATSTREVPALTPLTDPAALNFEAGNTVDTQNLTAAMRSGLACLQGAVQQAGGTFTVTSAYRPIAYQLHLREVWDRWNDLRNNREPGCATRRNEVRAEFQRHQLLPRQRPAAAAGAHTRGEALDANWTPPTLNIDALAATCNLRRPLIADDPVHFTAR